MLPVGEVLEISFPPPTPTPPKEMCREQHVPLVIQIQIVINVKMFSAVTNFVWVFLIIEKAPESFQRLYMNMQYIVCRYCTCLQCTLAEK